MARGRGGGADGVAYAHGTSRRRGGLRAVDDREAVDDRICPEEDHVSVVQPVSPLTAELIGLTRERFAGGAFSGTCPTP